MGVLLGTALDEGDARESQFPGDLLQPVHALTQGVQEGQLNGRLQDLQHQAGEAPAGAHVDDLLSPKDLGGQEGGAVQKVEGDHIGGVGDGGQVHDLILLQQPVTVEGQLVDLPLGRGETQAGEAIGQDFFQFFCHGASPFTS